MGGRSNAMDEELSPVQKKVKENAAKKQAYRETKKEAAVKAEPMVEMPDVEIRATEPAKKTLRERLGISGGAKPVPLPKSKRKTVNTSKLMIDVLPTLAASLIAAYCKDRLPVEYQPCAPTNAEVSAIIQPLMDMLSRRVAIAIQMSQDAIDITNSLIQALAYGVRAYVTFVQIRKKLKEEETHDRYQRGYHDQTATVGTDTGDSGSGVTNAERFDVGRNGSSAGLDDTELRNWEAEQVANLLRRDKQGRDERGLS